MVNISRDFIRRELHSSIKKDEKRRKHIRVCIFYCVFEVVSLIEDFTKKDIEKAAKLFIIIYFMLFGKELLKNGLFESKTKRGSLEGMLTICPGLEGLKFFV